MCLQRVAGLPSVNDCMFLRTDASPAPHCTLPQAGSLDTDIIHALEIVEDFFCAFDASSDGYLEQAEMERAMKGTNESGACGPRQAAALARCASGCFAAF